MIVRGELVVDKMANNEQDSFMSETAQWKRIKKWWFIQITP